MKKLQFWEKWNKDAQVVERSMTRLLQVAILAWMIFFNIYYFDLIAEADQEIAIDLPLIINNLVYLIAIFYPKYLKDFIDMKDKFKSV